MSFQGRTKMALFEGRGMAFVIEGISVKMLVFSGKNIESWYSAPVNPSWVRDGLVASPEHVGGIMADLVKEKKMPQSGVLAALPSAGSGNQVLTLPSIGRLKGRKLNEVVHRELRRVMPGSADVDYIYWQPLHENGARQTKQKVFTLIVPRVNVMSMVETSQYAGITMKALELRPFALTRAVGCKSGIIVHGEVNSIEVVIVDKSIPALFRDITVKEKEATAVPTVETAFQILFRDLPTTIEYYMRMNPDTNINSETPVYFSGSLSLEYDANDRLEKAIGHQVRSVEPPVDCPTNFPLAQYLVNVGLMMKRNW
jgi:hypothetical protein